MTPVEPGGGVPAPTVVRTQRSKPYPYARSVVDVYSLELGFYALLAFVLLAVKIFAFVSCLTFSAESYEAAGKLTKPAWTILLGLAVALQVLFLNSPIGILNLIFTIAAIVYLVDVRPAMAGLRRR